MYVNKRVDGNQAAIIRALKRSGCSVQSLSNVGNGCPDLLVGHKGRNVLLEIKDPAQDLNKQKLTPQQERWHDEWCGTVHVVKSTEEAFAAVLNDGGYNDHRQRESTGS